ncbi:MAG: uracil phosphoribosyltransferase [Clostridium fessum]
MVFWHSFRPQTVGHIGLYRDETTHEPHEYYRKPPTLIELRTIVVTDPMLATGGSAVEAIDFIKARGGKNIKFMAIIAAPEGLKRLHEAHPDVQIYVGHVDRCLNENAYICPGLGDAGIGFLVRNKYYSIYKKSLFLFRVERFSILSLFKISFSNRYRVNFSAIAPL